MSVDGRPLWSEGIEEHASFMEQEKEILNQQRKHLFIRQAGITHITE